MNFTEASLEGATSGLRRLLAAYDALRGAPARPHANGAEPSPLARHRERFYASLDDDLNTSGAVSVLFDLAAASGDPAKIGDESDAAGFMHEALGVLGISPGERTRVVQTSSSTTKATIENVEYRIERRRAEHLPPDALERLRRLVGEIVPLTDLEPPAAVDAVVSARFVAKSAKDFALADRLRKALAETGVTVADSKDGATWTAEA